MYMTEVVADEVILLVGRGESGGGEESYGAPVSMPRSAQRPRVAPSPAQDPGLDQGISDDDVPF
jgi:hypothetical protein